MRGFIFFLCLLGFTKIYSQNEIILNQYSRNVFSVCAANSALSENTQANLYYKKLWNGFADSPEITQLTIGSPVKNKNIGLGLNTAFQQTGIFNYITAQGSFAYKLKLNENQGVAFGLQAGVKRLQINFAKINALHPDELADLPLLQSSTIPTFDFSVAYRFKSLLAFGSANQLLMQKFRYQDASFQPNLVSGLLPHYLIGIQWEKAFKADYVNHAVLLLRSHQGLPVQVEISNAISWQNKLTLGIGYRQSYNAFTFLRVQITNDLLAGYSYEYNFHQLNKNTKGGHEFNLCYVFGKTQANNTNTKKNNNKAINEIFEEIDKVGQKVDENTKRVDTLDKNVKKLNEEMEKVKNKSLNSEEMKKLVDSLKTIEKPKGSTNPDNTPSSLPKNSKKYGSIVVYEDADKYKNAGKGNYHVVYGIFKIYNNAKEYVKLLARDHNISTEMIQLDESANGYFYVVNKKHENTVEAAVQQLKSIRTELDKKTEPITNGAPWVLIIFE